MKANSSNLFAIKRSIAKEEKKSHFDLIKSAVRVYMFIDHEIQAD